mmetsp:Transcript_19588/g.33338  ORF Transcript_19588/g.33338 Transcript_19588/m.33338 type:complete len:329 (-) Transcript_19588:1040-2026(-)
MRHRGTSVLALRLSAGLAAVALPCGVHCESPLPLWLRSLQHASDVRRAGQLTSIVQAAMAYAASAPSLGNTRSNPDRRLLGGRLDTGRHHGTYHCPPFADSPLRKDFARVLVRRQHVAESQALPWVRLGPQLAAGRGQGGGQRSRLLRRPRRHETAPLATCQSLLRHLLPLGGERPLDVQPLRDALDEDRRAAEQHELLRKRSDRLDRRVGRQLLVGEAAGHLRVRVAEEQEGEGSGRLRLRALDEGDAELVHLALGRLDQLGRAARLLPLVDEEDCLRELQAVLGRDLLDLAAVDEGDLGAFLDEDVARVRVAVDEARPQHHAAEGV